LVQRGFKAWCERVAQQYRGELGLGETAPLSPWALAKRKGILVWTPRQIPGLPNEVVDHLLNHASSNWSAATLSHAGTDLIILNSSHVAGRRSNDLMHELSHIICGHKAARVDVSEDGLLVLKSYDAVQEEEADLLAATLLLPRVALVEIKERGLSSAAAAKEYGVSTQLLTMRLNRSGVNRQFMHRRRKYGS
jgi:Zn-dependent peptidase ImmA (M78 family)